MLYSSYSPINTSKTKNLYSFAKSSRFLKMKPCSTGDYYQKPPLMGQKKNVGAGFGFGPKGTDLMVVKGSRDSVTPQRYNLPTTKSNVRKSFGESRDRCTSIKAFLNLPDNSYPGPGAYQVSNPNLDMKSKRTNFIRAPMEYSTKSTDLFSDIHKN